MTAAHTLLVLIRHALLAAPCVLLLTCSPAPAHSKHSALMSAINVTFVNFSLPNSQFKALEACAKCKDFQVG